MYIHIMRLKIFGFRPLKNIFRTKVTISADLKLNLECPNENNRILGPYTNRITSHDNNMYITDFYGKYTYMQLCENSKRLSRQISNICGSGSNSTVAFFITADILTITILWATWMSGQKALPLSCDMPLLEYNHLIKKTKVSLIISPDLPEKFKELALENSIVFIRIDHKFLNYSLKAKNLNAKRSNKFADQVFLDEVNNFGDIVTYSRGKNCKINLITRKELEIKIKTVAQSWAMSKKDIILYVCPSYSSYNYEYIFNLLVSASLGCQVNIIAQFDGKSVWRAIMGINIHPKGRPTTLIAEPRVFYHLILAYNKLFSGDKVVMEYIKNYCAGNIRLMVACLYDSNPIITSTWLEITGHQLRESIYSLESFDSTKVEAGTCIKLRIVNPNNRILLEVNGSEQAVVSLTSSTAVIGRVMKLDHDQTFRCTGEIVSYCNGVFKIIGRYV